MIKNQLDELVRVINSRAQQTVNCRHVVFTCANFTLEEVAHYQQLKKEAEEATDSAPNFDYWNCPELIESCQEAEQAAQAAKAFLDCWLLEKIMLAAFTN